MPRLTKRSEQEKKPDLARIDIRTTLETLGVRVKGLESGWLTCWCIFHDDGKNPNMRVHPSGGVFKCNSCGARGNILHIVERQLGVDRDGAWAYLSGATPAVVSVESIRESLAKKTWGTENLVERAEEHLSNLYTLVIRPTGVVDQDHYTIEAWVDYLSDILYLDVYLPRMVAGDQGAYYEFYAHVVEIWRYAENSGYLFRFPSRVAPDAQYNAMVELIGLVYCLRRNLDPRLAPRSSRNRVISVTDLKVVDR